MMFAAPQWLWSLWLVPIGVALLVWSHRKRVQGFERFAERPLWKRISPEWEPAARLRKGVIILLALALAILALARPQWGKHEESVKVTGLDVLIAFDVSNSMETEDVVPNRLKKAKHLVRTLSERLRGDRMGVVAFAASAVLASPLTTDIEYALEALEALTPQSIASQGTDIGIALETAARALERGSEESNNPGATSTASRVVLLISDGEDQEDAALQGARKLKDVGARLYVIGVGTEKGGPIPVRDESGQLKGFKRDRSGNSIVSTFRPQALKEIAAAAQGRYWDATPNEAEIDELVSDMGGMTRGEYAERKYVVFEERYQIFLGLAILLLLVEMSVPLRRLGARSWGTRSFGWILLPIVLFSSPSTAEAGSASLDAYLKNQEGLKAYGQGKIDEARRSFGEAEALDPRSPELQFNQGVVQYDQKDAENAIQAFTHALEGARKSGDPVLEGRALFNLGNSLSQKGDLPAAVRSYAEAIAAAQRAKDPLIEESARKNLQLLIQERQKQKEKQKQDQSKESQEQAAQKDQKDQKEQNGQQGEKKPSEKDQKKEDQDGKKQEPQRYQETGQRKAFKSEKLTREDADRVMAELASKEKELQKKKKRQRGNSSSTEKDW